jgi:hypothetical protein
MSVRDFKILPLTGEVSAKPTEGEVGQRWGSLPPPALQATSPARGRT